MIVPGGAIAVELRQVGTGEPRSSTVDCSLFICRAQSQKVLVGIASNRGGKALRHVAWAEMRVFVCGSISSALRRNAHYSFFAAVSRLLRDGAAGGFASVSVVTCVNVES